MKHKESKPEELTQLAKLLDGSAAREAVILNQLLTKAMEHPHDFIVVASSMGIAANESIANPIPSYTTTHSLDWIGMNIKLGSEMPSMHDHIDEASGNIIVDSSIADEITQRAPDHTRQPDLAAYLARPERKFGPIIAVVTPDWFNDPKHKNWDQSGRAREDATHFIPLESSGRVGLLRLNNVQKNALDGQHRVLGIRGLRDLRDNGFLQLRSKAGNALEGSVLSKEQFQQDYDTDVNHLQVVLSDSMVVEYVPAVVRGETRKEATRRVRAVFIAINSYAKRTDKGENIMMDENDGFSIVARTIAVKHKMFFPRDKTPVVDFKRTSIAAQGNHFLTTLHSVREVVKTMLHAVTPSLAMGWEPRRKRTVPIRPSETALNQAEEVMNGYFDAMLKLPVFRHLHEIGDAKAFKDELTSWRDSPKRNRRGDVIDGTANFRAHLLLRPIGQEILARAVAELVSTPEHGGRGMNLRKIFKHLAEIDGERGFEAHRPSSLWYGVTYSLDSGKLLNRNASWAHRLLVHRIDSYPFEEERRLGYFWKRARTTNRDTGEWITASGQRSTRDAVDGILPIY